jgi:hypothetical protein
MEKKQTDVTNEQQRATVVVIYCWESGFNISEADYMYFLSSINTGNTIGCVKGIPPSQIEHKKCVNMWNY